jgi:hypothetical protein
MLLMVQPTVAYELMGDREAISRGLLTRMYMFNPKFDRQQAIRHEVSRPDMRMFRGILRHHLDKGRTFMEASIAGNLENKDDNIAARFTDRIVCDGNAREIFANCHDEGVTIERRLIPGRNLRFFLRWPSANAMYFPQWNNSARLFPVFCKGMIVSRALNLLELYLSHCFKHQ